jgi:hypothetical protein
MTRSKATATTPDPKESPLLGKEGMLIGQTVDKTPKIDYNHPYASPI